MNPRKKQLVKMAYETVPVYMRNIQKRGIQIEEILEKDCWEDIPLLEKNQIISEGTSVMTPSSVPLLMSNKLIFVRTSGSSGKYMDIYWKKEEYNKSMFSLWYYRKKYYGVSPDDKMCYFYTVHNIEQEEDSFQRKSELGFSKVNLTMEKLRNIYYRMMEFQPKWLMLQPGMAMLLCRCMDIYDLKKIESIQYIEFSGEILTEKVRKNIVKHFECKTANQYGANEVNSIAYECPYGNMHLMNSNVCVEILNEEGERVIGEEGKVYVTSLTNSVMPLIRYGIGDRGKIDYTVHKCLCGNQAPVFFLDSGRANDWIIWKNDEKITPNVFVRAFDCVNYQLDGVIKQFQVVQYGTKQFQIMLAVEEEDENLGKEIERLFLNSLEDDRLRTAQYWFSYQKELFPDKKTGKLKWFRNDIYEED